jgi:flagellar biosynthesis protein FlhF
MQSADGVEGIREDLAQIREELRDLRRLSVPRSGDREGWSAVEEDLRGVRRLMGTLVKNDRDLFVEQMTAPLKAAYDWLLDTGLASDVAFSVVQQLHVDLPLEGQQLAETLRAALLALIAREIRISGPVLDEDGTSKAVMLVGPSGVGKTTTVAKLAAHYALEQKRKVALITLDTYRVAAVEQLRVYGTILGLSVDVALTCEDLAGLLRRRRSADLILIDTAGRSPLDQTAMRELKKVVGPNRQVEAHLLLSAATREADLTVILDRFMTLPVKSLIFSKLDETTQYGSLLNVLQRTGLPLSYLSTGQRVPEDLELATPQLLAEVLLEGITAVKKVEPAGRAHSRNTPSPPVETIQNIPLDAQDPAPKRNLLGALGWTLGRRSGPKSTE